MSSRVETLYGLAPGSKTATPASASTHQRRGLARWKRRLGSVLGSSLLTLGLVLPPSVAGAAPTAAPTGTPAQFAQTSGGPTVPVLVTFKPEASDSDFDQVVHDGGGQPGHRLKPLRLQVVQVPVASRDQVIANYRQHPLVERVAPAISVQRAALPNDPSYAQQWALPKIGWDRVYGSMTITGTANIAVLDTGIDASHPELHGRVGSSYSAFAGGNALQDPNGHGTAEAGIVAASTNNDVGIAGVAYPSGISLISVQVLGSDGSGLDSDVADGLIWATDHGAQVALLAFSTTTSSQTLADAVAYATGKGVVVVAATGNDGGASMATYPAGLPGVIGVAATDTSDHLAAFSNTASATVAAPGVDIWTTQPGGGYASSTGTSAAAAHVVGLAGLLLANGTPPSAIAHQVASTSDPLAGSSHGRIDVARALGLIIPAATATPAPTPGATPSPVATVTPTATAQGTPGTATAPDDGPLIRGSVVTVTSQQITLRTALGDRGVAVDSSTILTPSRRTLASLQPGELVLAHVLPQADGSLVARRLTVRGRPTAAAAPSSSPASTSAAQGRVRAAELSPDWPQHFHDAARTDVNAVAAGGPPPSSTPAWTAPNDGAAAVIVGGLVYHTTLEGNGVLYARDLTSGAVVWQRPLNNSADLAPPAVDNGRIFVSAGRDLQAFDAATGQPLWTLAGCQKCIGDTPPVTAHGLVYSWLRGTAISSIRAVDETTGSIKFTVSGTRISSIAVVDSRLLFWDESVGMRAVDALTGAPLWTYTPPINTPFGRYYLETDELDFSTDSSSSTVYALVHEPRSINSGWNGSRTGLYAISTETGALTGHIVLDDLNSGQVVDAPAAPIVYAGALQLPFHPGGNSSPNPNELLQLDPVTLAVRSRRVLTDSHGHTITGSLVSYVTGANGLLYMPACGSFVDPSAGFGNGFFAVDPATAQIVWEAPETVDCPEFEIAVANGVVAGVDWQQLFVYQTSVPRTLEFVHGINQSFRDIQTGRDPSFKEFFAPFRQPGGPDLTIFPYYQDLGYSDGAGGCTANGGMPDPDQRTGPLFVDPVSIDPTICDSKGALAYSAAKLDDDLGHYPGPTTVLTYSMGGAIARGWLALAQSRQDDPSLRSVDTLILFQGASQGSYTATVGDWILDQTADFPGLDRLLREKAAQAGFDPGRPAIADLTPASPWYASVNSVPLPATLHYFTFYTDMQLSVAPRMLLIPLAPAVQVASLGDLAILPGTSNPADMPKFGGARFLPGGVPTADRHEFAVVRPHTLFFGDVLADISNVMALRDIATDPAQHLNLNQNLNTGQVLINSCARGGALVRPLEELQRIWTNPTHACGA